MVEKQDITPALTKDVSFNDKVQTVEAALKSRVQARRDIQLKWAAVISVLNKYNLSVPTRRPTPDAVASLANTVTVYHKKAVVNHEYDVYSTDIFVLNNLANKPTILDAIDKKFQGVKDYLEDIVADYQKRTAPMRLDEERTREAKAALQSVIDAYLKTLESYDETVNSVADVKEYINIVKSVAEISAIANGKENN